MKYLIILLVLIAGCVPLKFRPTGSLGTATPYYADYNLKTKCSICKKDTVLFKIDNKGRKICPVCYKKHFE